MTVRRRVVAMVSVCVAMVAVGCTPPPTGGAGPVPACPVRQTVVVEQTDQTDFSLVRGISDNGRWLVTSRTIGTDLELTLREVGSTAPGTAIGTIEDFHSWDPNRVAVSDDGQRVVFDATPSAFPFEQPSRWDRSSGSVEPLSPPEPGASLQQVSYDLRLAAWSTEDGATTFTVTDTLTDAVIGTSWTGVARPHQHQVASPTGRFAWVGGIGSIPHAIADYSNGTTLPLSPAIAQIGDGWEHLAVEAISPDGSKVIFSGERFSAGSWRSNVWAWDFDTETLRELDPAAYGGRIADDGRAVLIRPQSFPVVGHAIEEYAVDGSVTTIHAGSPVNWLIGTPDPASPAPQAQFLATPDLRTVAFTTFASPVPPTARVVAARCS